MKIKDINEYMCAETGTKYKKTNSQASAQFDADKLSELMSQVQKDGYIVFENVLDADTLQAVRAAAKELLTHKGRNNFEGFKTQRIYSVIAKTMACNALVEHPLIMALLDQTLMPGYLLSQLQVINILPGEAQQPLHMDDGFYPIERPRKAFSAATVWAIDDFTSDNGGTVVIPGSHTWGEKQPDNEDLERQINVEMPAGSVVYFLGNLWHGGGANISEDKPRLAVTAQYCEPWCRTQENISLSVPKEIVAQCSEDINRMLGYSIYGPFMGFVDGKHPKRLLENL
jgi:ectoine hydroxylase-related dioxygenase (phytanoyl-CoA dioxygenase family)